jgi:hypothetical protein
MTSALDRTEEHGFQEVYTNDSHMLKAAPHFHLTGVNVLGESRSDLCSARKDAYQPLSRRSQIG